MPQTIGQSKARPSGRRSPTFSLSAEMALRIDDLGAVIEAVERDYPTASLTAHMADALAEVVRLWLDTRRGDRSRLAYASITTLVQLHLEPLRSAWGANPMATLAALAADDGRGVERRLFARGLEAALTVDPKPAAVSHGTCLIPGELAWVRLSFSRTPGGSRLVLYARFPTSPDSHPARRPMPGASGVLLARAVRAGAGTAASAVHHETIATGGCCQIFDPAAPLFGVAFESSCHGFLTHFSEFGPPDSHRCFTFGG